MTDWGLNYFSIMTIATKNRVVGKHIFAFPATRFEDIPIIS